MYHFNSGEHVCRFVWCWGEKCLPGVRKRRKKRRDVTSRFENSHWMREEEKQMMMRIKKLPRLTDKHFTLAPLTKRQFNWQRFFFLCVFRASLVSGVCRLLLLLLYLLTCPPVEWWWVICYRWPRVAVVQGYALSPCTPRFKRRKEREKKVSTLDERGEQKQIESMSALREKKWPQSGKLGDCDCDCMPRHTNNDNAR